MKQTDFSHEERNKLTGNTLLVLNDCLASAGYISTEEKRMIEQQILRKYQACK